MNNLNKNTGITLIALVVTIIVLLILAGISISMLTGQNGIINRTAEAKEKTNDANDLEYLQVKAYEAMTEYYAKNNSGAENEFILGELGKVEGIETNVSQGTIKYNGKTYDVSEVLGNTNEKKSIESNGLKQITAVNAKNNDKNLFTDGKIRMIIEENTENPSRAVIPTGFYYVKGTPSEGVVISDKFGDDDNNSKGGNQFVWVPCNGNNGVTYEKENGLANTWKIKYTYTNDNGVVVGKQSYYTSVLNNNVPEGTWSDNSGNKDSVKKYGGFYIARYEAGVPSTADFYANSNETTYTRDEMKNVSSGNPVSKKNNQCWNFISQQNAVEVSKNMYKESTIVSSSLVDSYAWDTIVEWMTKDETNKNLGNDSTSKGNYYDNTNIKLSNALYALHRYADLTEAGKKVGNLSSFWSYATKYKKGSFTSGSESVNASSIDETTGKPYDFTNNAYDTTNYSYKIRKELATGSAEETKIKEIYDMAGNMWEWTTETGKPDGGATQTVFRGGSFLNSESRETVSYRYGHSSITDCDVNFGFRVVLYIK